MWYVKCWETDRYVQFCGQGTYIRTPYESDASRFSTRLEAEYALQDISLTTGFVTRIT